MRKLIRFKSSRDYALWAREQFGNKIMRDTFDTHIQRVDKLLSNRRVTGDNRDALNRVREVLHNALCMFNERGDHIGVSFRTTARDILTDGGPAGSIMRHEDIRDVDVGNESVGWTMGLAVLGAWAATNDITNHYSAMDFVPDEHNWDNLDFPDQFGRPRLADGTLLPMEPFSTYKYVEPTDDDPFGYWVTDVPGSYVPRVSSFNGYGKHLDGDDMYAMSNQHKPLDQEVMDDQQEVTDILLGE